MKIPRAYLLIFGDRMSSFPWLTLILWDRVKVSKQINAEKCDLTEQQKQQQHFNICKEIGVKLDNKHSYDYLPKSVETSYEGKVTILWNQKVWTDGTAPNK